MKWRRLLDLAAFLVWASAVAYFVMRFHDLVALVEVRYPSAGAGIVGLLGVVGAAGAFILLSAICDLLFPHSAERKKTRDELRHEAERRCPGLIKSGNLAEAMRLYEVADLLSEAVELAVKLNDQDSQIRIFTKLGRYGRARKICVELGRYEEAANLSNLLGEIADARELYREAATLLEMERAGPPRLAPLWDRAGGLTTAAHLYEQATEFELAGECYDLLHQSDRAKRLYDNARVLNAYEGRNRRQPNPQVLQFRREEDCAAAKLLESTGDFFGAAQLYRKCELWMDAGISYEKIQEWERAARAYDKAGLTDRAQLVRTHLPPAPKTKEPEEQRAGAPAPPAHAVPPGAMLVPAVFVPAQARFIPLNAPDEEPDPEVHTRVAQRLRRGNFEEAAHFALEAKNWLLAAALLERAGKLVEAADLYRRIGKPNDAAFCLERAGRPREAALLSLGIGNLERSRVYLARALEESKDLGSGLLLAETLVRDGKAPVALELLRKRMAPGGPDEENAWLYWRLAQRLEENEMHREAFELYMDLINAGAVSSELDDAASRVAAVLHIEAPPRTALPPEERARTLMKGGTLQEIALDGTGGAHVIDFEHADTLPHAAAAAGRRRFLFKPPDLLTGMPPDADLFVPASSFQISLFGEPESDEDAPAGEQNNGVSGASLSESANSLDLEDIQDTETVHLLLPQDFPSGGLTALEQKGPRVVANTSAKNKRRRSSDPFMADQRYAIRRELARGGMGVVYEAVDTRLGRSIALKVIREKRASPEEYQQFLLEARAIARITHPNVITIYDIGVMNLNHYITMELVRGGTLTHKIKSAGRNGLSIKDALRFFIETARGLKVAHENGIVHRDIKPSNLLLTENEEVRIVDFGLAKLGAAAGGGEDQLFATSGTPGYMSPEQIQGQETLPRSDIYALGIVLFYLLTGIPPHAAAGKSTLRQVVAFQLAGQLPKISEVRADVPPAIEEVYHFCTLTKPEDRYQVVDQFLPVVEQWHNAL